MQVNKFHKKNFLVLGAGISGMSVAMILKKNATQVILSDAKKHEDLHKDFTALEEAGVVLALGNQEESLLSGIDYVVMSPGISIYIPLAQAAIAKGIAVISEVEVAYHLCAAPIVAITGTNGKTTTTTLLGEMLKTTGRETVLGGNIGLALSKEVEEITEDGIVVAEISSFQLEGVQEFHPHIAAILNITPDHLDRHRTMDEYSSMKERIFAKQTVDDYLILNYDDVVVRKMADKSVAPVLFFSRQTELTEGIFVKEGRITIQWRGEVVDVAAVDTMQIRGAHNVENALVSCGAAFFAGVTLQNMATSLQEFAGVEHRIEPVATINSVMYYNDSKATNPESSIKALEAFAGHVILLAGGRDKNTDLTELMQLAKEKVEHLILFGEAQARFNQSAMQCGVREIHLIESFNDAVKLAHRLARSPQIVLLSPACASYDMFDNYEERGKIFKKLVSEL